MSLSLQLQHQLHTVGASCASTTLSLLLVGGSGWTWRSIYLEVHNLSLQALNGLLPVTGQVNGSGHLGVQPRVPPDLDRQQRESIGGQGGTWGVLRSCEAAHRVPADRWDIGLICRHCGGSVDAAARWTSGRKLGTSTGTIEIAVSVPT
ncbi:hypothetical protein VTK56DRAFT_6399 [Thermocarpiscus australiensis]